MRRGDTRSGGLETLEMRSQRSGSSGQIRRSVVSFHNVTYHVSIRNSRNPCRKVPKQVLNDISGFFPPGMNAILGPSGCGKTSLLDVLAGRKDFAGLEGQVLVDGQVQPRNFKCLTGYVSQDDIIMGSLSVRENIMFSANLRLRKKMNEKQKQRLVSDVIEELGLTKCADSKVGNEFSRGISGGERKRTNIGMELIISPSFLFLDEPTTGLDASTANAVMASLRGLSTRGRTIIFSIHQPRYSIFEQIDRLLLLSQGHSIYHGPASEALQYFSSIGYECEQHNNPPDFFLDVINGDSTAVRFEPNATNTSQNIREIENSPRLEEGRGHPVSPSDNQTGPESAHPSPDNNLETSAIETAGETATNDVEKAKLEDVNSPEIDKLAHDDRGDEDSKNLQNTNTETIQRTVVNEELVDTNLEKFNCTNYEMSDSEYQVKQHSLPGESEQKVSKNSEDLSNNSNNGEINTKRKADLKIIDSENFEDKKSENVCIKVTRFAENVAEIIVEDGNVEIRCDVIADIPPAQNQIQEEVENIKDALHFNYNKITETEIAENDLETKMSKPDKTESKVLDMDTIELEVGLFEPELIEQEAVEPEIEILEEVPSQHHVTHQVGTGDIQIFVSHDASGLSLAQRLAAMFKESTWSVENEEYLRTVWSHFEESGGQKEALGAPRKAATPYATSLLIQLLYLSRRTLQNVVGSPQTTILQFMVMLFFGLVIGSIYYQLDLQFPAGIQNRTGAFFFIIVAQMFGNMSAIEIFLKDRKMFMHESSSGFYRVSAYYIAKMCCDVIPMRFLPLVVFAPVSYFMMGLRMEASNFFIYFCNLFLTTMSASSLGFLISSSVTVSAIGNIVFALVYVTMVTFGGYIVNLSTMSPWLSWLKYLSIIHYSLNTFYINELEDQEYYMITSNGTKVPLPDAGNWYLKNQGVPFGTDWDLWQNIQALALITLGFQFFTYVQLRRVDKHS